MNAATSLMTGNEPLPALAEQAVLDALARAGSQHANSVLLFLSGEFTRHAHTAVLAAARAAQCTQVFGGIAAGLCTETGWVLDRPAVAAMVLCGPYSLASGDTGNDEPVLCCTSSPFPSEWADSRRFGTHFHGAAGESAVWQLGRPVEHGCAEARVLGAHVDIALSTGLRSIGTALPVDTVRGYDVLTLGGQPALDSLLRLLPPEWQNRNRAGDHSPLPLHLINATIGDLNHQACVQAAAVISVNDDRSVSLTVAVQPGQQLCWAIRQPLAAEAEMREAISGLMPVQAERAQQAQPSKPDFGLFFSCIGRGPYFYGGEDRDLAAVVERFPGMPLIGTYGTGQIAFSGNHSRQLQNSVVTALFSESRTSDV